MDKLTNLERDKIIPIVDEVVECKVPNGVVDYLPASLMQCAPFSQLLHDERQALFLGILESHFSSKYPDVPAPEPLELYRMQAYLLDEPHTIDVCLTRKCHLSQMQGTQRYFSKTLKQYMIASGIVFVCSSAGTVHICDRNNCHGEASYEGFVCPISGICKDDCHKVNFEGSMDERGDGSDMTTVVRQGYSKRAVFAKEFSAKASMRINHVKNDFDDTVFIEKDYTRIETEDHVSHLVGQPEKLKENKKRKYDQEEAYALYVNVQRSIGQDSKRQTIEAPGSTLTDLQKMLMDAQKQTAKMLDKLGAKPTRQQLVTYHHLRATTNLRAMLHLHAKKAFDISNELGSNVALTEDEILTCAHNSMINELRDCVKKNRFPNFIRSMGIYHSTIAELTVVVSKAEEEAQRFLLVELMIFYWDRLRDKIHPLVKFTQNNWMTSFRNFVTALLDLMQTGFVVVAPSGELVEILPKLDAVVTKCRIKDPGSGKDKPSPAFRSVLPVKAAIATREKDVVFLQSVSYTSAMKEAQRQVSIPFEGSVSTF